MDGFQGKISSGNHRFSRGQAPGDAGNAPGASRGVAEDVGEQPGPAITWRMGIEGKNSWDFIVI